MTAVGDGLATCDGPLAEQHDVGLYDLDGVLYVGPDAVAHAADCVAAARAAGMRAAFVTNNASRRPEVVAEHLSELGLPARVEDVVTSAQAAARVLAERLPVGASVLVLGTSALADEVSAAGLVPVRDAVGSAWTASGAAGSGAAPVAVAQGLSRELTWTDLAEATVVLRSGALWVAGSVDATLPSPRGPLPGNGALVAALVAATGREPVVAGKPEPALHRESVERSGAERPLVVGDRLDTDVLGAVRAGTPSLLVLTGVTDRAQLLAAPRGQRPSYVAEDLRGLLQAHPPVRVEGGRAVCGRWTARWVDGEVTVQLTDVADGPVGAGDTRSTDELSEADGPDGPGVEALRAACALAWARADGTTGTAEGTAGP